MWQMMSTTVLTGSVRRHSPYSVRVYCNIWHVSGIGYDEPIKQGATEVAYAASLTFVSTLDAADIIKLVVDDGIEASVAVASSIVVTTQNSMPTAYRTALKSVGSRRIIKKGKINDYTFRA